MKFLVPLGLAAIALAVAAAATWRSWSAEESRRREPAPRKAENAATGTAGAPAPASYPASLASEIVSRIDNLRLRREYHRAYQTAATPEEQRQNASVREEITALGDTLADHLLQNPASWPDVIARLSKLDSGLVMLEVAHRLNAIVDDVQDVTLRDLLRKGETIMARRTAIALLAESPTPESLQAYMETAQQDMNSQIRYEAFLQMIRRRTHPELQTWTIQIDDVIRRQCAVEPDPNIKELMSRHLPGQMPPGPALKPRHKGGPRLKPGMKK